MLPGIDSLGSALFRIIRQFVPIACSLLSCHGTVWEEVFSTIEESAETVRLDLWLWSVRLFKTRSLAANACKNNRIEVNGRNAKASRQIRTGDRIKVERGSLVQEIEVKEVLVRRVGAKRVPEFLIDHTPVETYQQAAAIRRSNRISRPDRLAGSGRPTKKERRDLDKLIEEYGFDPEAYEE